MRRLIQWLAIFWALTSAPLSYGSELDDDLRSLWESLWTQTGYPMPLSRWEIQSGGTLYFRFSGYNADRQKELALKAVSEVVSAAGLTYIDVSNNTDAEKTANIHIEYLSPFTTNSELGDRLACAAFPKRNEKNLRIESVRVLVKDGLAPTCMHHELMHALGVPGHPSGKSILSYFPWRQDQLAEFDKRLLKVWYSPKIHSGQLVFEVIGPMTKALAANWEDGTWDKYRSLESKRIKFIHEIIREMADFANGRGEIPTILRRSGMTSSDAIIAAKSEIAYNLGSAYQSGELVISDIENTIKWYELAASQKHVMAHIHLYYLYANEGVPTEDPVKAFQWLTLLSRQIDTPQVQEALQKHRQLLTAEQVEQALKLVRNFQFIGDPNASLTHIQDTAPPNACHESRATQC